MAAVKIKSQVEKMYRKKQLIYDQISEIESIPFHSYTHSQLASSNKIMQKVQKLKMTNRRIINNKMDNLINKL